MAFGDKTNERPGTRSQLRHARFSAYKAREVLNLIRNQSVGDAQTILEFTERSCSEPILKCLNSAIANAVNNDSIPPEELFVSACYADEGPTMKRFRPRARGRAGRIRKRTCHVTIIVSRYEGDELIMHRQRLERIGGGASGAAASSRARRVASSRRKANERAEAQAAAAAEEGDTLVETDIDEATDAGDAAAETAAVDTDEVSEVTTDSEDTATAEESNDEASTTDDTKEDK